MYIIVTNSKNNYYYLETLYYINEPEKNSCDVILDIDTGESDNYIGAYYDTDDVIESIKFNTLEELENIICKKYRGDVEIVEPLQKVIDCLETDNCVKSFQQK